MEIQTKRSIDFNTTGGKKKPILDIFVSVYLTNISIILEQVLIKTGISLNEWFLIEDFFSVNKCTLNRENG